MCMWTQILCSSHSIVFGAQLLAFALWRMCMWTQILCSSHSIVFGAQLLAIPRWRMCMWTQMLCSFHSIVFGAQLLAVPRWRMYMCTQMLCSSHSIVFGAQLLAIPRRRMCMCTQMLYSSHSIVTGAQLLCSCILLFLLLTFGVFAVVCHWKEPFAWMKDFAWQPTFPTDCRTAPTTVILHPIGVSLRSFVSLVTYVLRTRTPNTVISCQRNIFTLWVHPAIPATNTKTKESGYSFHTIYFCFKNACRRTGEPG